MKETHMKTIKKYSNRKLYDTETSTYCTLQDILLSVAQGNDVAVIDQKTGVDITQETLTEVIHQWVLKNKAFLPAKNLHEIIRAQVPAIKVGAEIAATVADAAPVVNP
jgi:polyhydroxyalkanoate synthesis repressor PhaR